MDKAIPCGSKICTKRIKAREQQMHRERVRNMKSTVDTGMPTVATLEHVKVNLKKEQMMEDRYTAIDRDNRILLKKMTEIMKQQTTFPPSERKPGPSSLNKDARRKELLRITRENQSILKRIQQAQPVYNHVEWEDQHRRNATYLKNRCEFPVVLRTPRRGRDFVSSELVNMGEEEEGAMTSRSAPSTSRAPPKDLAEGANQKYVLKEGMKLSDTYYLVDMSTDGRNLFVSAYDNSSSTTLELVIKEKLHRQLYRETNGDYRRIADRLKVTEEGKLLLDGEEALDELDAVAMVRANKGSLSAR
ncbi:Sperm axonemal maintenance protein CFAP97D1 (CFAP97 domain-containing protein 1) [Durusdinium trenchii]|uniref:Sperm axonemal maintenance protein CFAP97D1 (CFAP97 domain-containing protein 1) n=1 Tax=Durusdinium trenchii TaxID=1381693 RepID=A0ABP0HEL0_9DINO